MSCAILLVSVASGFHCLATALTYGHLKATEDRESMLLSPSSSMVTGMKSKDWSQPDATFIFVQRRKSFYYNSRKLQSLYATPIRCTIGKVTEEARYRRKSHCATRHASQVTGSSCGVSRACKCALRTPVVGAAEGRTEPHHPRGC